MNKKKLAGQLAVIFLMAALFAVLDIGIYQLFIKRVISHDSPGMQKMSVDVADYVPFTDSAKIPSAKGAVRLEGDLPKIDGATALLPVYAGFIESIYPKDSVKFDGEKFLPESAMHYSNTTGAYKAIVDGNADIIICAQPSDEQLKYAAEKGVELEMVRIGSDAFVFIVNAGNPVSNITLDQVRGIYSGKIKSWKELGGKDVQIAAMQRSAGSGSQTALEKIMGDEPIVKDYTTLFGSPIGFSFRYYVTGMLGADGVKILKINGVEPTPQTIADNSYPVSGAVYAVYRKGEKNANVQKAIDFMLSPEGQKIVEKSGYIPINPTE